VRQEPHGQRRPALAALGVWRSVVEITIDVEDMHVLRRDAPERLGGPDHDAAIAADQQGNVPGLLQVRRDALADTVPGDTWSKPVPDRRDRVMGKIARDRDVPVVERLASDGLQPRQQLNIAIGLSVVFTAGVQRAGAEGNSQDVVGRPGLIRMP